MKRAIVLFLLIALATFCLSFDSSAYYNEDSNIVKHAGYKGYIYFDKSSGTIVDCDRDILSVSIPEYIDGVKVERIGYKAFDWCTHLESISIPKTVLEIEEYAFFHCNLIDNVTLNEGLEVIRESAFEYCNFNNIIIPKTVGYIGDRAFSNCRSLYGVVIDSNFVTFGNSVFSDCYSLEMVVIANKFEFDYSNIFIRCYNLGGVIVSVPPYPVIHGVRFRDVKFGNWYYEYVRRLSDSGIFFGVSKDKFSPDSNITRAMFVTALWRIAECPEYRSDYFDDVYECDWYFEAVSWAYKIGIVEGKGNKMFKPNDPITRGEMAVLLFRLIGHDVCEDESSLIKFSDSSSILNYEYKALNWASSNELITGIYLSDELYLLPNDPATRSQASAIICRFLDMSIY